MNLKNVNIKQGVMFTHVLFIYLSWNMYFDIYFILFLLNAIQYNTMQYDIFTSSICRLYVKKMFTERYGTKQTNKQTNKQTIKTLRKCR